jgi:TRAP-type uncharacterized transport system substrate-binding protein
MDTSYVRWGAVTLLVAAVGLASYGVVRQSQQIGPGRIVVATGSPQYVALAETYREDLERYGVQYEVQQSTEGFRTLRALLEEGPGINAGFIKGGLVGSLTGRLATEKAQGRYAQFSQLQSVGRLFYEPIWVFTRGDLPITSLRDLKGKRILTGTWEGGTRRIAMQLLRANGVVTGKAKDNPNLIRESLPADAAPLLDGRADAAILIEPADSEVIQSLLRVQDIRLMDFSAEAAAYDNRFPALSTVVMHRGSVDFEEVIPSADITLLTTSVALVVRKDMHPSLISLLTQAVLHNPKAGGQAGDPVLFHPPGLFPPETRVPSPRTPWVQKVSCELALLNRNRGCRSLHGVRQQLRRAGAADRDPPARPDHSGQQDAAGGLRMAGAAQTAVLVRRAQDAGEGPRHPRRQARRCDPPGGAGAHRRGGAAHPRAALFLERALRPAPAHRPGAPAPLPAASRADGGGVAGPPASRRFKGSIPAAWTWPNPSLIPV